MENLKKCPFCGGGFRVNCRGAYEHENENCFLHGKELKNAKDVEAWNNRATEAELRASVIDEFAEHMKEILKSSKEAYENMAFTYAVDGSNNKYIYEGKIEENRSIERCVDEIASQMKGEKE